MTKKTLSERIALRAKAAQGKTTGKQNLAIFLSLKNEIETALNDGWSGKEIWRVLLDEKKIDFSYQTFRRNVNKLIKDKSVPKEPIPAQADKEHVSTPGKASVKSCFAFDSQPKKKDLL